MISTKLLYKATEKFVSDNAPAILTGIGAAGTVTAAILTGKATIKAVELYEDERERRTLMNEPLDIKQSDLVKLVWKEYLPAAGVCTLSVASIIYANHMNTARAAALAAAYSLNQKRFEEYRNKVSEKFNPNKEQQVRDEIAQDQVNAKPPSTQTIIVTGSGKQLMFDSPTGRYFEGDIEKVRQIENEINSQANVVGYATLSDFYVAMKLVPTPYSDEFGWTCDDLMRIEFSTVMSEDNRACISIDYFPRSIRNYLNGARKDNDPPF